MIRKILITLHVFVFLAIHSQTWNNDEQYIQNFAPYAVEEMEKYKIPASITLAQGLLETGGGQSRLALQGKNHFGIKCKEDWTGKTMKHTDDAPNECFRVYDDPRQSYRDHSIFLATRKYYTNLFTLDMMDYKSWAHGLKKAGYATNPKYAHILISKIEKYKLYEFDKSSSNDVLFTILKMYPELKEDKIFMAKVDQEKVSPEPKAVRVNYAQTSFKEQQEKVEKLKTKSKGDVLRSILVKNHPNGGLKFFVVPDDIELGLIARKFGITETRLKKYNEIDGGMLMKNQIIFLESKNTKGNIETYKVEAGESMHDIAQKFAIKLDKLYAKNKMKEGQQPNVGQLLYLQ